MYYSSIIIIVLIFVSFAFIIYVLGLVIKTVYDTTNYKKSINYL
jgi:hypothetical protein